MGVWMHWKDRRRTMATAQSSTQSTSTPRSLPATAVNRLVTAIQGLCFWATIVLPLVITSAIVTGHIATAPNAVSSLVPVTFVCALCSRSYSPRL